MIILFTKRRSCWIDHNTVPQSYDTNDWAVNAMMYIRTPSAPRLDSCLDTLGMAVARRNLCS